MDGEHQQTTFSQMKEANGSLLSLWSKIERALAAGNLKMAAKGDPKPAHCISRSLDAWSERILSKGNHRPL